MSFAKAWYRAFPGKVVSLSPAKKEGSREQGAQKGAQGAYKTTQWQK
jgi:hypothetical protein